MAGEQWSKKTWKAQGSWRYRDMKPSYYDGTISRTYKEKPTPEEVRLDLQTDAVSKHGYNATVDRIAVHEVLTTHLFDA